ncbi:MAG: hypothetical protein N2490_09505 [Ignavibacteria bacterium]|nr:hypothetical protein [Ignavibacteria bacterium]
MNKISLILNLEIWEKISKHFNKNETFFSIIIIVIASTLYNLYFIIHLPIFLYDDFTIFRIVKDVLSAGNYLLPDEKFFLFWRPVTFVFFILEYLIFGNNPLLMKIFSLLLQNIFLVLVYIFLRKIFTYLKIKEFNLVIVLIVLCINLHPVTNYYIIWISQVNTLIMLLFLVLSLIALIKYIDSSNIFYSVFSIISYTLSILSKQHSSSFPLFLFVFLFFFSNYLSDNQKKKIKQIFFYTFIITLLYYIIFYSSFLKDEKIYFLEYLYKKPFVIASSVLYYFFPYKFTNIYAFFVHNFLIAIIIGVFLLLIVLLLLNKVKLKALLFIMVSLVVSFFPQIMMDNELRNLNIQILLLLILTNLYLVFRFKKIVITFLFLCLIIYPIATLNNFEIQKVKIDFYNNSAVQLAKLYENGFRDFSVILSFEDFMIGDHLYYLINKDFGKYNIDNLAVNIKLREDKLLELNPATLLMSVTRKADTLDFNSVNEAAFLTYSEKESIVNENQIHKTRYVMSLKCLIPDRIKDKKLIYYDGIKWNVLK